MLAARHGCIVDHRFLLCPIDKISHVSSVEQTVTNPYRPRLSKTGFSLQLFYVYLWNQRVEEIHNLLIAQP
ncbi:hypothetical protein Y032_0344g3087 [Ancylostoma ceylanicum]|uniref:Uncharacterized protein n=1 Tax=Ancylostoma ceylanicum TaxID=53326 RepID=A0A016RYD0_9BILA|nr:hypothetical protein Y032_0344g3087 [Ancylostoma ceylanicum]